MRAIPIFGVLLVPLLASLPASNSLASSPATPRPAKESPCLQGSYDTLTFWDGEWDVAWKKADGTSGTGISHVSRDLDGCVVRERFDDPAGGFSGMSQSSYNPHSQQWIMAWADNTGQPFVARGAANRDPAADYVLNVDSGNGPRFRIIFQDVKPTTFTWRFQTAPRDGTIWADLTVSHYRKRIMVPGRRGRKPL